MNDSIILHEAGGKTQLHVNNSYQELTRIGQVDTWKPPLGHLARERLRWYLEDYLTAPYSVFEKQAQEIESELEIWKRSLFEAARLKEAAGFLGTRHEGKEFEVWISSDSPEVLSQPWELLLDCAPQPISICSVARRRIETSNASPSTPKGKRLRILLVVARPFGKRDVGYRTIARHIVAQLSHMNSEIDLEVLRPPTFRNMEERLRTAYEEGKGFHVLHFDGHGKFDAKAEEPRSELIFENSRGQPYPLTPKELAQATGKAGIPLVVLNACHSASLRDGSQPGSAIASQLLENGTDSVIAMAYSVYARAAAKFMTSFYEHLFAGKPISRAIAAGRKQMREHPQRPSPRGQIDLEDWFVPVQYVNRQITFERLVTHRPSKPKEAPKPEQHLDNKSLLGRDSEFLQIERALRSNPVLLIYGIEGIGKSELASAFARWFMVSGGLREPSSLLRFSFEGSKTTGELEELVELLTAALDVPAYFNLERDAQKKAVQKSLDGRNLILIIDSLERFEYLTRRDTKPSSPGRAIRRQIADFIANYGTQRGSFLLLASRSRQDWLGAIPRLNLSGLDSQAVDEYTDSILDPIFPAAERASDGFRGLLRALNGHPRCLGAALSQLPRTSTETLLEYLTASNLQNVESTPEALSSLAERVALAIGLLDTKTQEPLPALSLFEGLVSTDLLALVSLSNDIPARFQNLTAQDWRRTADHCVAVGILNTHRNDLYTRHPLLRPFLMRSWSEKAGERFRDEFQQLDTAYLKAQASFASRLMTTEDGKLAPGRAIQITEALRGSFEAAAVRAIDCQLYSAALCMIGLLIELWRANNEYDTIDQWTELARIKTQTTDGSTPSANSPGFGLWLTLASTKAAQDCRRGKIVEAESTYRAIHEALQNSAKGEHSSDLKTLFHQLGRIEIEKDNYEQARSWLNKSIEISEKTNDPTEKAGALHSLATIALARGDLDAAEQYFHEVLSIDGDHSEIERIASCHHNLGIVAERRKQFDQAEESYRKSLTISDKTGNLLEMASTYHQLGSVSFERGAFDEAEKWNRKALRIREQVGLLSHLADSYHNLGLLNLSRGDIELSEA